MQVAVWDTYVTKKDGALMHFDIVVPESEKDDSKVMGFGKEYLKSKNQEGQPLTSKECSFCHIEQASKEMLANIHAKGYYIVEMQGCQ
jgi:Domain of unknown function (DUF2024)